MQLRWCPPASHTIECCSVPAGSRGVVRLHPNPTVILGPSMFHEQQTVLRCFTCDAATASVRTGCTRQHDLVTLRFTKADLCLARIRHLQCGKGAGFTHSVASSAGTPARQTCCVCCVMVLCIHIPHMMYAQQSAITANALVPHATARLPLRVTSDCSTNGHRSQTLWHLGAYTQASRSPSFIALWGTVSEILGKGSEHMPEYQLYPLSSRAVLQAQKQRPEAHPTGSTSGLSHAWSSSGRSDRVGAGGEGVEQLEHSTRNTARGSALRPGVSSVSPHGYKRMFQTLLSPHLRS